MRHMHPPLLIIFLTFTNFALNIPNTTTTPLSAYDERFCWPKETLLSRSPKYKDCATAIDQLPKHDGFDAFHNGDPTDPYQLPLERTSGTCTVRVELRGSSRIACTWVHIVSPTRILNIKCLHHKIRSGAASVEIAGGVTARLTGGLFASLEYPRV